MSLLALHGFTQSPAQWAGIFEDCVAPWLPGHGPEPEHRARSFDEAIDALLDKALSLPSPRVLVGYSMGARLGLGALVRQPGFFARAVLIGVQPGLLSGVERDARRSWERGLIQLLEERGLDAFLAEWEHLPLLSDQRSNDASHSQAAERRRHTPEGLVHALSILGLATMPSYWDALGEILCPVELIVGTRDAKFLAVAQQMLPLLRKGRLHTVAGSGHNPLVDAPQATRELLLELAAPRDPEPSQP